MKATIDTKELREAVNKVNMIPRKGHSLPITQHDMQIIFDGEEALLTSTDLNMAIQVRIKAESDGYATLVLNRNTMQRFLSGGNGTIVITSVNPAKLTVERSDIGTLRLLTNDPKDYPPIPDDKELKKAELDAKTLLKLIDYAIPACASDTHRPVLNGIVFKQNKMASADGFRLVSIVDKALDFGDESCEFIVPLNTILLIKRLFKKSDTIKVEYNKQRIIFTDSNTRLTSQLVQGNFPQYEQLIPKDFVTNVAVSVPLLSQRISMVNTDEISSGIIRYIFNTNENEQICTIQSGIDDDYMAYNMNLPVTIKGVDNKIAINYRYMLEAIKPFSLVNIELNTPSSPIKITGDIEGLTVVVMPMFVQW